MPSKSKGTSGGAERPAASQAQSQPAAHKPVDYSKWKNVGADSDNDSSTAEMHAKTGDLRKTMQDIIGDGGESEPPKAQTKKAKMTAKEAEDVVNGARSAAARYGQASRGPPHPSYDDGNETESFDDSDHSLPELQDDSDDSDSALGAASYAPGVKKSPERGANGTGMRPGFFAKQPAGKNPDQGAVPVTFDDRNSTSYSYSAASAGKADAASSEGSSSKPAAEAGEESTSVPQQASTSKGPTAKQKAAAARKSAPPEETQEERLQRLKRAREQEEKNKREEFLRAERDREEEARRAKQAKEDAEKRAAELLAQEVREQQERIAREEEKQRRKRQKKERQKAKKSAGKAPAGGASSSAQAAEEEAEEDLDEEPVIVSLPEAPSSSRGGSPTEHDQGSSSDHDTPGPSSGFSGNAFDILRQLESGSAGGGTAAARSKPEDRSTPATRLQADLGPRPDPSRLASPLQRLQQQQQQQNMARPRPVAPSPAPQQWQPRPAPQPRPQQPAFSAHQPVELSNLRASITAGNIPRLNAALAAANAWMNENNHRHQIYETVTQMRITMRDARKCLQDLSEQAQQPQPFSQTPRMAPGVQHRPPGSTGQPGPFGMQGPRGPVQAPQRPFAPPPFRPPIQQQGAPPFRPPFARPPAAAGAPPQNMPLPPHLLHPHSQAQHTARPQQAHPMARPQQPPGFRGAQTPSMSGPQRGPIPLPTPLATPQGPPSPVRQPPREIQTSPPPRGAAAPAPARAPVDMDDLLGNDDHDCIVCLDNPREMIFIPCGHLITCQGCAQQVKAKQPALCPLCRTAIMQVLKPQA
ncbi:hypothetical protein WJX73_002003 [Symbiochloris irregularis]|uniref:RING-type domain-containing protein n=1 Tax=Symbiochloris irregularis TaxID=706552 RepID=A0AAW1NSW6_9CHLO